MRLEQETFNRFLQYLREHGYPEESFGIEYRIGKRYRADLVILDQDTGMPISLFEVKSSEDEQTINMAKAQITAYLKSVPDSTIPTYIVFPRETPPYFVVQRIFLGTENDEIYEETVGSAEQLDYASQRRARVSELTGQVSVDRKDTVNTFRAMCWVSAALLVILGVLNKVTCLDLNTIDISLVGAAVALIVLPFAGKMKVLGWEFERLESARKRDK